MKNLSPRAKKILSIMAQDEARKFGSQQILPEHVLLAIFRAQDGVGVQAVKKLGLKPEDFRNKLEGFLSSDNNFWHSVPFLHFGLSFLKMDLPANMYNPAFQHD